MPTLPIFVLLVLLLNVAVVPSKVLAKEPEDVKIDCSTISSTLPFEKSPESSADYMGCNSYTGEDIAVSDTLVVLSGNISLDPLLGDANKSRSNSTTPSKTEDLLIGDGGKIIYWGPPWGKGPYPQIEFRAKLGLCDMELTGYASGNITLLLKSGNSSPDWQAAADFMVEKLSKAAKEIEANIAAECGAKNAIDTPKTGQKTKSVGQNQPNNDKENLFTKALGSFPVLIGEWFRTVSTGLGMGEFFYESAALGDEILRSKDRGEIAEEKSAAQGKSKIEAQQKLEDYFDKQGLADLDQVLNRAPVIKDIPDYKTGQWQKNSPFRLDILDGQAQIKYPGETEWKDMKVGDKIPPGSTIFTGMDATAVLSIRNKGVVQILSFTEIIITEEGLADPTKTTTDVNLRTGEIELDIKGPTFGPSFQVSTTNAVAGVRGTHFWVSYNKKNRLSTVGVYKGEVEVKALGSDESSLISPNGDKPGVIMVARRLSIIKLILTGVILVAIAASITFFFKRRRGSR